MMRPLRLNVDLSVVLTSHMARFTASELLYFPLSATQHKHEITSSPSFTPPSASDAQSAFTRRPLGRKLLLWHEDVLLVKRCASLSCEVMRNGSEHVFVNACVTKNLSECILVCNAREGRQMYTEKIELSQKLTSPHTEH